MLTSKKSNNVARWEEKCRRRAEKCYCDRWSIPNKCPYPTFNGQCYRCHLRRSR